MTPTSEAFARDGYVHLPGLLVDYLEPLRQEVTESATQDTTWPGPWQPKAQKGGLLTSRRALQKLSAWAWACQLPALVEPIEAILDGPVFCQTALAIVKPPTVGQAFPWHQDAEYYGDKKLAFVIAYAWLDDATAENGSLRVLPGSHAHGWRPHVATGIKRVLPDIDERRAVDLDARAGDVTLLSLFLVHGSRPNTSDQPRRAARLLYQRA